MRGRSKAQQKAASAAAPTKRGESQADDRQGPWNSMYKSMSEEEFAELASTMRKGLPDRKD